MIYLHTVLIATCLDSSPQTLSFILVVVQSITAAHQDRVQCCHTCAHNIEVMLMHVPTLLRSGESETRVFEGRETNKLEKKL